MIENGMDARAKEQITVANFVIRLITVFLLAYEPVEKVTFLKTVSSAGLKIGNYFLSSKVFTTPGATPKPLSKMETISTLYYDCLTLLT